MVEGSTQDMASAWYQGLIRSDESSFEALFRTFHGGLVQFAAGLTGEEGTAGDVVKDAFVRIWRQRKRLDPQASPRALLFRTVRTLALDHRREAGDSDEAHEGRQREALVLSRFQGLPYQEIADVMDVSARTVDAHVVRALRGFGLGEQAGSPATGSPDVPPVPSDWTGQPDAPDLERIWVELEAVRPAPVPVEETDRAWAELRGRMGTPALLRELEARTRLRSRGAGRWWSPSSREGRTAAAALLGLLATGSLALLGIPGGAEAPPGEMMVVTLPDGSTAELNSGSSLRWRRSVRPAARPPRTYRLSGEAFLSVVPGGEPLVVETYNARVTVLGTRFNVRAREGMGSGTQVVVVEGRVRLTDAGSGESAEVTLGETAAVAEDGLTSLAPRPVELDRVLAWRAGGFHAEQQSLRSILEELSLRYGVDIELAEGVDAPRRLTVRHAGLGDVRAVLSELATASGLRFRETDRGFEVY